jgi:hypothetical protein
LPAASYVTRSCGDLNLVVARRRRIRFKNDSLIAASICAPESSVAIGTNKVLLTHAVAATISVGDDNSLQCCAGIPSDACGNGTVTGRDHVAAALQADRATTSSW